MGETVRLTSAPLEGVGDGFVFDAWRVAPADARRGGLVILHAIWGVTPHLRSLAETYAERGYEVLIPSLFDRFRRGLPERDIDPARMAEQMSFGEQTHWGEGVLDAVQAAIDALAPPVFALGFCFGGTTAWLAAARCKGLSAVASYYGGNIAGSHLGQTPKVPTILHLGRTDELIPPADVAAIRKAHPDLPVFEYDAGHAFVAPNGYDAEAERLSTLRTLALFTRSSGRGEN